MVRLLALLLALIAGPALAQPEIGKIAPELIAAAKKEGKLVWYTAVDVKVGERVAKAFEAKFPGVAVVVERSGGERIFQRIAQEYGSRIYNVDVVNSSDVAHFLTWKKEGWLVPFVPEDVAAHWPAQHKDADGTYATWRSWLSVMGYNTKLVSAADAPKSFADLLNPKWAGKIVKAHPGYSGTILTATFAISRDIGWEFFEKLAKQRVMQVQSSTEPPKKIALGERPIMADGNEYNMILMKEAGEPVEIVYPAEGTPSISGPSAVMKNAKNPNAARLFQTWLFTAEGQQLLVDVGGLRSIHPNVKEKPGRKPLSEIKLLREDPAALEPQVDRIKAKYTSYFKT